MIPLSDITGMLKARAEENRSVVVYIAKCSWDPGDAWDDEESTREERLGSTSIEFEGEKYNLTQRSLKDFMGMVSGSFLGIAAKMDPHSAAEAFKMLAGKIPEDRTAVLHVGKKHDYVSRAIPFGRHGMGEYAAIQALATIVGDSAEITGLVGIKGSPKEGWFGGASSDIRVDLQADGVFLDLRLSAVGRGAAEASLGCVLYPEGGRQSVQFGWDTRPCLLERPFGNPGWRASYDGLDADQWASGIKSLVDKAWDFQSAWNRCRNAAMVEMFPVHGKEAARLFASVTPYPELSEALEKSLSENPTRFSAIEEVCKAGISLPLVRRRRVESLAASWLFR
jgi:hypothetical protein